MEWGTKSHVAEPIFRGESVFGGGYADVHDAADEGEHRGEHLVEGRLARIAVLLQWVSSRPRP
jgi:hypothetical protein